jgi:hypothetical protein
MSDVNPISSFVIDKKDLTQDELWKLILYCASIDNLTAENWEIEIIEQYHWISGHARGEDTGKFWEFLSNNKLDNKIDILRG